MSYLAPPLDFMVSTGFRNEPEDADVGRFVTCSVILILGGCQAGLLAGLAERYALAPTWPRLALWFAYCMAGMLLSFIEVAVVLKLMERRQKPSDP